MVKYCIVRIQDVVDHLDDISDLSAYEEDDDPCWDDLNLTTTSDSNLNLPDGRITEISIQEMFDDDHEETPRQEPYEDEALTENLENILEPTYPEYENLQCFANTEPNPSYLSLILTSDSIPLRDRDCSFVDATEKSSLPIVSEVQSVFTHMDLETPSVSTPAPNRDDTDITPENDNLPVVSEHNNQNPRSSYTHKTHRRKFF